ncbi:MAG: ATP-binding cassette domain-containing protein [Clostridiales bacterium]|nr:ATP-binding cassette domain-containing protein [Clostridiales bacterium]
MLELRHIRKTYNPGTVNEICFFRDFSLKIGTGQFVSVVGSNGSGKTSMLNIICGSINVDEGQVIIGDQDISRQKDYVRHRRIGRVYQNPALGTCPDMTIMENLSLAENKGKPYNLTRGADKGRRDAFRSMLEPLGLGLEDKLDVQVKTLSGGQRQALALLMSTMTPIDFLILDEHTAALDPKTAEIIMKLTGRIVAEKRLTTIMVTHNLRYAVEYGDRLLMMHEGHVIMDRSGEEKKNMDIREILAKFDEISLEVGN